jgi:hypothetical protein
LLNLVKNSDVKLQHEYSAWNSPFLLDNESEYQHWKKAKLERYSLYDPQSVIRVAHPTDLSPQTLSKFAIQLQTFNYAFYEIEAAGNGFSTSELLTFGQQLGLHRIDANLGADSDGVTLVSVVDSADKRSGYIPYTSRALNWHTDGYYNPVSSRIDAFLLYCVNQAGRGGENFLLDPEMVYMQIRDTDPDLLTALMDTGIMIVPANISNNRVVRQAESGPVFIVDHETGRLNMRYSARPRNIGWKSHALSIRAVNLVRELLMDNKYITKLKLKSGQGIVCNNVLHGRRAFVDGPASEPSRLYYRARYYDAVTFPDGI